MTWILSTQGKGWKALVAALVLSVTLAAGPVAAQTVTSGSSEGHGKPDRDTACSSARGEAEEDANCSGTLSVASDCTCRVVDSVHICTTTWTCTISASGDAASGDDASEDESSE